MLVVAEHSAMHAGPGSEHNAWPEKRGESRDQERKAMKGMASHGNVLGSESGISCQSRRLQRQQPHADQHGRVVGVDIEMVERELGVEEDYARSNDGGVDVADEWNERRRHKRRMRSIAASALKCTTGWPKLFR